MQLVDQHFAPDSDFLYPKKYGVSHHLSINAFPWATVGIFENVIFTRTNGYDFSYLNPVAFLVSAQQQNGSPDKTTAEGEFDMPYEFINQRIAHVIVPTPVPLGYWRSVGHSHNAFFKESFIDELAFAAKQDPVVFRRGLLTRQPRFLAVLDAAVERAGKPEAGHALGVALHRSFGTIVAQVAEVSVENNEIKVHKVTCAVDCGIAINPNIIAQQVESAVNFGLSAALYGEVTIKEGKVEQQNFDSYQVVRMLQSPQVDTIIIKSAEPPEGMGEPATPPIAPAVANAVFILTGKRLRSLPLRLA